MFVQQDLTHIDRQIKKAYVAIDEARKQAEVQRQYADQKRGQGNRAAEEVYRQQANQFEQRAEELETEIDDLTQQKQVLEERAAELEGQLQALEQQYKNDRIRITDELNRVRGSAFML